MKMILHQNPRQAEELSALKTALGRAQQDLAGAYSRFNEAVDPELVEACCYEISAGKARCSYLLRRIKTLCGEEGQWEKNCFSG